MESHPCSLFHDAIRLTDNCAYGGSSIPASAFGAIAFRCLFNYNARVQPNGGDVEGRERGRAARANVH